jgi:DNA polymerase-3 subunit delta
MRLRAHELEPHLQQQLAPVYVLSGDEPLQLGESADAVRAAARARDFLTREVLEAEARFDWDRLGAEADALSLFAEKRVIDLRIPSGKPGREGGAALCEYCARPPADTLLLVSLPKLDRTRLNSKWCKALEQLGVLIQIWPIEGDRLTPWLEQRMRALGLAPEHGVAALLADRVEGNLLAARQEIEKLLLIHGPGVISVEQLTQSVSDSARFDVFDLVDSALAGEARRCVRILTGLRQEGIAAPVVLWALSREFRLLAGIATTVDAGASIDQALAQAKVWEKRKGLLRQGLSRLRPAHLNRLLVLCQESDAAIKGANDRDPWLLLEYILLACAGKALRLA